MTGSQYMQGFVFCTRYYYRHGNLDIPVNAITNNGFKIGAWLEEVRNNIDNLTSFQISDLSACGMIWEKDKLGGHANFSNNLKEIERLAKKNDGKISAKDIENPALREWCMDLTMWRKKHDNAILTYRECEMLTAAGFIWDSEFGYASSEYSAFTYDNSYVANAIKKQAMDLLKQERGNWSALEEKEAPVKQTAKAKKEEEKDWMTVLFEAYISGKNSNKVTNAIRQLYIAKCKTVSLFTWEVNFLRMLNDNNPGFAKWIIPEKVIHEVPGYVTCVVELNSYGSALKCLKGVWVKSKDKAITESGYPVQELVRGMLTKYRYHQSEFKDMLMDNIYEMYFKEALEGTSEEGVKTVKGANELVDAALGVKKTRKRRTKKAKSEEDTVEKGPKKEKEVRFEKVKFANELYGALGDYKELYGYCPNTSEEVRDEYSDKDKLKSLLDDAMGYRDWLTNERYMNTLKSLGYFYLDKARKTGELRVAKAYSDFIESMPKHRGDTYPHPEALRLAKLYGKEGFDREKFDNEFSSVNEKYSNFLDVYNSNKKTESTEMLYEFIPKFVVSKYYRCKAR